MSNTAGRVLRATTTAIALAVALAACQQPDTDAAPVADEPSVEATTPPASSEAPVPVAPKTQRPGDPPRSAGPDPC